MINVSIETLILELLRLKNKRVVIEVNSHKGVVPILIKRFESQEKECYVYFGDYDCKRWQFGIKKNEIENVVVDTREIRFDIGMMKYKLLV